MDVERLTKITLRVAGVWSAIRLGGHVAHLAGVGGQALESTSLYMSLFGLVVWLTAEYDWRKNRG